MQLASLFTRARGKARRVLARSLAQRVMPLSSNRPLISFTFDDAPTTAFERGREILARHDANPTYFVSLGLLDTDTECGRIGSLAHLKQALATGAELGCHTFDHLDAWHETQADYIASVARNRSELDHLMPGASFRSFAYPKSGPTAAAKYVLAQSFDCCRGGGQALNEGRVDLNLVSAYFLDRRQRPTLDAVCSLIERNAEACGWLVFVTHDICDDPSPYGCTPAFLDAVARHAQRSGAHLLPFVQASFAATATRGDRQARAS